MFKTVFLILFSYRFSLLLFWGYILLGSCAVCFHVLTKIKTILHSLHRFRDTVQKSDLRSKEEARADFVQINKLGASVWPGRLGL